MNTHWIRQQFPSLQSVQSSMTFMDNAGGSQTVCHAIDAMVGFLTECDVQLGASYATSVDADARVTAATAAIQLFMNAANPDEIVMGPSSTALVRVLSLCLAQNWQAGDEIIITDVDHEANRTAWLDLQKQGLIIKTWSIRPDTLSLETADLLKLMTDRTRLVCFTHVSNILGSINPLAEWTRLIHTHDAKVCVDGVAYAPHRLIDVQAWDVDFYFFSTYKTFAPHQAVLYGKHALLTKLPGFNHHFITHSPYKFQPGNVNYEMCCAMAGVVQYLCDLGAGQENSQVNREHLTQAFEQIAAHEAAMSEQLLSHLTEARDVTIIGDPSSDPSQRVATISFTHKHKDADEIVKRVDPHQIGIRFGDFYAVELINQLGLREKKGVVRVSLAHYNTIDEMNTLLRVFDQIF